MLQRGRQDTKMTDGVFPSQTIRAMADSGQITANPPIINAQVQPASLDLRLGKNAWRVRASFLPGAGRTLEDRLPEFAMHDISLEGGAVLEKGCVYLVPLMEGLDLPPDVSAVANAKSSTGRLDLFTRLITDHGSATNVSSRPSSAGSGLNLVAQRLRSKPAGVGKS